MPQIHNTHLYFKHIFTYTQTHTHAHTGWLIGKLAIGHADFICHCESECLMMFTKEATGNQNPTKTK